jgi:hypothetical protein
LSHQQQPASTSLLPVGQGGARHVARNAASSARTNWHGRWLFSSAPTD